ncbi:hypothetical protein [Spirosoma areae]
MVPFTKKLSGLLILGTVVFSACKSPETTPTDRVSVGLNQSARLGSDVVVQVDSIQDSRCPANVVCIWAGEAKVKLALSKNSDSKVVRLVLGADVKARLDSTNVSLANQSYKVILREVNPYPGTSADGQPQMAVVQVTKL